MTARIMQKMIDYSKGSLHDIEHFIKVHSYAAAIARLEKLDPGVQTVLEIAAIVHDIACPMLRERYGRADGKLQEIEGPPLARALLADCGLSAEQLERVLFLVAHHHTPDKADGIDYQILIEADYLVNASESGYSRENIENTLDKVFKTAAGRALLKSIYLDR